MFPQAFLFIRILHFIGYGTHLTWRFTFDCFIDQKFTRNNLVLRCEQIDRSINIPDVKKEDIVWIAQLTGLKNRQVMFSTNEMTNIVMKNRENKHVRLDSNDLLDNTNDNKLTMTNRSYFVKLSQKRPK